MHSADPLLQHAYDPERFRRAGHQLIDQLADFLASARFSPDAPVLRWQEPDALRAAWAAEPQAQGDEALHGLFARVLEQTVRTQSPRYVGHQIAPAAPAAALAALLGALLNNGMGVYEMGMAGTVLEQEVIRLMNRQLGYGPEAGGFITSGGSLGNLTALLAARQAQTGFDAWEEGAAPQPLAVMVSEQAHYCVARAAKVMGLGEAGVIKVPVDGAFRMRTELLDGLLAEAQAAGRQVIAIAGSACTTATGSFDDLAAIAAFAQRHGIWFHVDAAHGGPTIFSRRYRPLVAGIEQADSVVVDFHKMMLTPALATAVLFRSEAVSFNTFAQKASYLWDRAQDREWYNLAKRTFECTKQMMGLEVFALLHAYGPELFAAHVDTVYSLGAEFAGLVRAREAMELAHEPQCNIVCFRYAPPGMEPEACDALNQSIRTQLLREGRYYMVQTRLGGRLWLRVSLMNPFTDTAVLYGLLDAVEAAGRVHAG
jgi:L-2,4-diaminobutyrate decarboxylase